jgi:hypothetical protein
MALWLDVKKNPSLFLCAVHTIMTESFVAAIVDLACNDFIACTQTRLRAAIDTQTFAKYILQRLVPVFFPTGPSGVPATDIMKYPPSVNADQPDKLLVEWKTDKHSVRFTMSNRKFVVEEVDGEAIPADKSTFTNEGDATRFIIARAQADK